MGSHLADFSTDRLALLHRVSLQLNSTLNLDALLRVLVEQSCAAFGTRSARAILKDGNGTLTDAAACGMQSSLDAGAHARVEQVMHGGTLLGLNSPTLYVPLHVQNRLLGVLYLDRAANHPFDTEDVQFVLAFADSAALAIHNAQQYQTAARSADELRRLYDTSLDITSQLEIPRLLDLIIQRAAELLHGDSGNFYLYDDKTGLLVPCAPYGQHTIAPVAILRPGEGATGRVFISGEPLIIQNYDTWEGRLPNIPMGRYGRVLHVPVKRGGQVLGVMSVNRSLMSPLYTNDDLRLLLLFANQAAIAIENARLIQVAIDKARMEQELMVARQVQSSLIPRTIPNVEGWQFAVHWQPAREVSGDFYDFIPLGDGRMGFVIGDVTGKGVPAALMMATTRSLLRGVLRQSDAPGDILERLNALLYADMPVNTFITVFYAILDPVSGHLRYANSGHDLPYHRAAYHVQRLNATGVPLGLMPGIQYEEKETTIRPGDSLLFYSDGLIEAHNPRREMLGFERVGALVGEPVGGTDLIRLLLSELAAFTGPNWDQEDDITIATFERCHSPLD